MKNKIIAVLAVLILANHLSAFAADNPALPDDLKRGLILYFNFDNAAASEKIADLSGNGNDGQVVGAKWVADGHQGGAYRFAPPNQFIHVANSSSLNPPQVTLAVWIKTMRNDDLFRRILDKDCKTGYSLTMGGNPPANSKGRAYFELNCETDWDHRSINSDLPVNDGRWHHLVGTFDASGTQRLYVDGRLQKRILTDRRDLTPNTASLTIGMNPVNPAPKEVGASFDGLMDDVMMFNRALSAAEVQTLFTSQGGVFAPAAANASAVAPAAKPDATERLKKVKALYDQGLINKDDYNQKVKEIMDSL